MTRTFAFDHLVMVVSDVEVSLAWYQRHLGLEDVRIEEWRRGEVPFPSLRVSADTIIDFIPGRTPTTGPASGPTSHGGHLDHVCFVVSPDDLQVAKADPDLEIEEEGLRFGARGIASSIYVRDPDQLLVEIRAYPPG